MTFREGPRPDRASPLTWAAVGSTVVALAIAVVLLLADKHDAAAQTGAQTGGYGPARNEFDEMLAPVMGVLTAPVRFLADASTDVRGYFFAVSENRRLRERLREMERWRDAAIALKNVNERYEALLQLRTEPAIPMVSARVVADARGPFSNARLADAGTADGVATGQPVLSEHGVVGRIVGAGRHASRVLLLTDAESRTPVLVDRTNARAILTGDGGANPRLEYLRGGDVVRAGDVLLTSGDGGVYPRGLPVGVAAQDVRGVWRARLYADRQALDYVRVLTYVDFGRLASEATLVDAAPPPLDPTETAQLRAALAARTPPPPTAAGANPPAAHPPASAPAGSTAAAAAQPSPPRVAVSKPPAKPAPTASSPTRAEAARTHAAAADADVDAPPPRHRSTTATVAAHHTEAPAGETAAERARRLKLRALTRDAAAPAATMRPIPDPQDDR